MLENSKLIKLNRENYYCYQECIQSFQTKRFPNGESFFKSKIKVYIENDCDYAVYAVLIGSEDEYDIIALFAMRTSSIFFSPDNIYSFVNPCIELSYFSINDRYTNDNTGNLIGIGLGTMIFFDKIIPLIRNIKKMVGVNYITIFSLPIPKVIHAYENMGFNKATDDIDSYIKYYDVKDCKLMFYNLNNCIK